MKPIYTLRVAKLLKELKLNPTKIPDYFQNSRPDWTQTPDFIPALFELAEAPNTKYPVRMKAALVLDGLGADKARVRKIIEQHLPELWTSKETLLQIESKRNSRREIKIDRTDQDQVREEQNRLKSMEAERDEILEDEKRYSYENLMGNTNKYLENLEREISSQEAHVRSLTNIETGSPYDDLNSVYLSMGSRWIGLEALYLAELEQAGFPVPNGFIISSTEDIWGYAVAEYASLLHSRRLIVRGSPTMSKEVASSGEAIQVAEEMRGPRNSAPEKLPIIIQEVMESAPGAISGVLLSHDPVTGAKRPAGQLGRGVVGPSIDNLLDQSPAAYLELAEIGAWLEKKYGGVVAVEFSIKDGRLRAVQARPA